MKLKITGGTLEVEILEGSMSVDDVKSALKKLSQVQAEEVIMGIREAGRPKVSPHSSKSNQQNKLNAKPRMSI